MTRWAALFAVILLSSDAVRLLKEGRTLLDANRLIEAEQAFRRAHELDPKNPTVSYYLGLTLLRLEKPEEAAFALERARDLSPQPNASVLYELGTAYVRTNRLDAAEKALAEAARLAPDRADLHLALGWVYYSKVDGEKAEAEFERALQLSRTGIAYFYLGLAETALGKVEKAVGSFRQAVALSPRLIGAQVALGKSLLQLGRDEDAERALRAAVSMDPGAAEAHFQLGILAQRRGRIEDARHAFESALGSDPRHRAACYNLALVYERLGLKDEAQKMRARLAALAVETERQTRPDSIRPR